MLAVWRLRQEGPADRCHHHGSCVLHLFISTVGTGAKGQRQQAAMATRLTGLKRS